jgi:hypothetical protein
MMSDNFNQINNVSIRVLHNCNIWKHKNKNNNKMLKSGEGKLMMTNGVSINDFMKKYKFLDNFNLES